MPFPPPPPPPPPQNHSRGGQQPRNPFPPPPPPTPPSSFGYQQQSQAQSLPGRPLPPPTPQRAYQQQHNQQQQQQQHHNQQQQRNQQPPQPRPPSHQHMPQPSFSSRPPPSPGPQSNMHQPLANAYPMMRAPPSTGHPSMQQPQQIQQQLPQQQSFQTRPPPPPSPYGMPAAQRLPPQPPPSSRYPNPPTPSRPPPPPPSPSMQHAHGNNYASTQPHAPQNPHSRYPSEQQQQQPQSTNRYPASAAPCRPSLFTRSKAGDETNTEAPLSIHYPKGSLSSGHDHPSNVSHPSGPPADSRYISLDDGNATLDFLRPTMYNLPSDRHILRNATGVSDDSNHKYDYMGVLCTPMALPSADHPPPPLDPLLGRLPDSGHLGRVPVDFTTNREAPPRCGSCNAYVNPFWSLSKCNFCHRSNKGGQIQTQYGDKVGTVDYPVMGPYITRKAAAPVKPHWIFCVDLTSPKVLEYVDLVLDEIWPAFYNEIVMPHIDTTQRQHGRQVVKPSVAMVFVCSTGIYIPQKVSAGEETADSWTKDGFLVMPDVAHEEAFSPLPLAEWSWSLPNEYEDLLHLWKTRIRPILLPQLINDKVKNYVKNPNSTSQSERKGGHAMSAGGAALEFLVDALEESGGRAVLWTWRRPNYGLGAIPDRELLAGGNQRNKKDHGTSLYMALQDCAETPKIMTDPNLNAAAKFYKKLGERCIAAKVALDIVVHTNPDVPQSFLDLATLGRLCEASSGRLIWIGKPSYESSTVWKQAMREELMRPLYWSGWDAVFKVRCSLGLQIRATVSSTGKMMSSSSLSGQEDEVEFPVVTPETCLAITLEHRVGGIPAPKENKFAFVQTALLYTNPWTGDRRVRVSTLAIRVTTLAEQVLPAMDFGALAALQLRLNLPHTNYSSVWRFTLDKSYSYRIDSSTPDQKGDSLLTDARHDMFSAMRQVLVAHRTLATKNGRVPPQGTSWIPDSLKNWPLFVMSAAKSPLLRPSQQSRRRGGPQSVAPSPRGDERAYYLYHARKVSPASSMLLVSPLLLDLNATSFEWQKVSSSFVEPMANMKNSPVVDLPPPLPASVSNLAADGIYLLDTCFVLYVLIQQEAHTGDNGRISKELKSRIINASQQLQLWSQVGREPKSLRPTASLPVVVVRQKTDEVQYQALLRWMALDATSHDKDFGSFCLDVQKKVRSIA